MVRYSIDTHSRGVGPYLQVTPEIRPASAPAFEIVYGQVLDILQLERSIVIPSLRSIAGLLSNLSPVAIWTLNKHCMLIHLEILAL